MTNLLFLKNLIIKYRIFIIGFVTINTLVAFLSKNYLHEEYKNGNTVYIIKATISIGKMEMISHKGNNIRYFDFCGYGHYSDFFKEYDAKLKIDLPNHKARKMYLYVEGKDKEFLAKKINNLLQKLHLFEKLKSETYTLDKFRIVRLIHSSLIEKAVLYKKDFYLNNYFIFSVFLLSFILSMFLSVIKQRIDDKSKL